MIKNSCKNFTFRRKRITRETTSRRAFAASVLARAARNAPVVAIARPFAESASTRERASTAIARFEITLARPRAARPARARVFLAAVAPNRRARFGFVISARERALASSPRSCTGWNAIEIKVRKIGEKNDAWREVTSREEVKRQLTRDVDRPGERLYERERGG